MSAIDDPALEPAVLSDSDPGFDSGSDGLPDVSQLIQEQLTQSGSSVSGNTAVEQDEDIEHGLLLGTSVKEEDEDEEPEFDDVVELTDSPALKASKKSKAKQAKSGSASSSKVVASSKPKNAVSTPAASSRKNPLPVNKRSAAKKRARDIDSEGALELPQIPASQPPPHSTKRARYMQPPSASQPLPSTPAYKGAASSKLAPPSTARSNAKNKATMRKRSENFWHLDGSVVIQIQNTLFRLHRSRLTQHSEYFMSLFSSGNGTRDSPAFVECDTIDSCPVYIVKGHLSVLDFERLLTALDAGIAYAIHPPPFHVLCSLIRAAHALSFKTILEFATHHLREMWPSDLARLRDRDPAEPATEQALRVAQATHTILLAQECELPELRKAAYHALLCARTQSFGQDLAVYVHAECADGARRAAVEREEHEENAPPARLAASDFVRLVNAEQRLRAEWLAIARAPPLPSAFPCPIEHQTHPENAAICSEASLACKCARKVEARIWLPTLMEQGVFEAGMTDVFVGLQELADMDWKEMGYCMGCVSERRDAWMEKREKLWKKLDVFLGLKDED